MRGKSSSLIGAVEIDVVVEAVLDGRAEGQADAGEEPHDGPGHDVGARMPQHAERFRVPVGEQLERDRIGVGQFLQRPGASTIWSPIFAAIGRFCEPLGDAAGDVEGVTPAG